jgi:hypothetical protein
MEVITRKDAKARGLTRYFTGKACLKGHVAERRVLGGYCVECAREGYAKLLARPEFRAKKRDYLAKWRATPEGRAKKREYDAKRYATPEGRAVTLIAGARKRAKAKGLDFDLDVEWVADRIKRGCAILGEPFNLTGSPPVGYTAHPRAPSLDRIDSSRGYTRDNVWVICDAINRAKGSMSLLRLMGMCKKVAARESALKAAGLL